MPRFTVFGDPTSLWAVDHMFNATSYTDSFDSSIKIYRREISQGRYCFNHIIYGNFKLILLLNLFYNMTEYTEDGCINLPYFFIYITNWVVNNLV